MMGGFSRKYPAASNAAAQVLQASASPGVLPDLARADHQHGTRIIGDVSPVGVPAGYVGEVISSTVPSGSAVALTSGVTADITSRVLTTGVWFILGRVSTITAALTAPTSIGGSLELTGTPNTFRVDNSFLDLCPGTAPGALTPAHVGRIAGAVLYVAATMTIYLNAKAVFSGGTLSAYGQIVARRYR